MYKGPVLQVDDTKSSTMKKVLNKQQMIFEALDSAQHYFHNTLINLAIWVSLLFSKSKCSAFQK